MKLADIFNNPILYKAFQNFVVSKQTQDLITTELIKPENVIRVLDFGCGIGSHSLLFNDAEYLGIEPSASCIKKANTLFSSDNKHFKIGDHSNLALIEDSTYDLVMAIGVLHHVDDDIVTTIMSESFRILKTGGRIITVDPVKYAGQSKLARWVVSRDRGRHVRQVESYEKAVKTSFEKVEIRMISNHLRIPYDEIWMTGTKS